MKMLIQIVLIAGVLYVVARLFRSRGARAQAIRRVGLLLFAAFAVISILFPNVWNRIAALVGVGRGTDMVLYALVVAFLSSTVTTYLRFREVETRYTRLARRLALDEVGRTATPVVPPPAGGPADAGPAGGPRDAGPGAGPAGDGRPGDEQAGRLGGPDVDPAPGDPARPR